MGRAYAVASGKGGVGKTATAAGLGTVLAAAGHDIVVVDADLGMPNLGSALGVESDTSIHDVLAGTAPVSAATVETAGMDVVPGSRDLDAFARSQPAELDPVTDDLREQYDYVILDTGAGLSNDTVVPLEVADETVLVSTPVRTAVADTERAGELSRKVGTGIAGLVLNHADESDAVDADVEVVGTVPKDRAIADSMAAGTPIVEHAAEAPAVAAYRSIAAEITGASVPARAPAGTPRGAGADDRGITIDGSSDARTTAGPRDRNGPETSGSRGTAPGAAAGETVVEPSGQPGSAGTNATRPPASQGKRRPESRRRQRRDERAGDGGGFLQRLFDLV